MTIEDILGATTGTQETSTGTEAGAGNQETPVVTPPASTEEFNAETSSNIAQFREKYKALEKDLGTYKPVYEQVSQKFGDPRNLEIAHTVYSTFAGEEFDPERFSKVLEQLSPSRSKQIFDKVAETRAQDLTNKQIEKLFGGKISEQEVQLFKKFRESGYGLVDGEDIPEALKFDAEGNPRSEDEVNFFRSLQKQIKESRQVEDAKKKQDEADAEVARVTKLNEDISKFSNERLSILEPEFKGLGLEILPTDTAEQQAQKASIRQFIINGVSGHFMADPNMAKDYNSALEHISNGESLLARTYEAAIEKHLLDTMRSPWVQKLLASLTAEPAPIEVRPDISKSGASGDITPTPNKIPDGDDIYAKLVREGKVKP